MRIPYEQLERQLDQSLAPVYVIAGEEPLLAAEAFDSIREQARVAGFAEREVLHADAGFDWSRLTAEANTLSLFAERRILDVRLPGGKPGTEGAKALTAVAEAAPEDILLLVTCGKWDRATRSAKWLQTLEQAGVLIEIWPVDRGRLPQWIARRMRARGLQPDDEAVAALAERVEGNLLAAAQEIDKLQILLGEGRVSVETVLDSVGDSARFDVFRLVDAALASEASRALRILHGLRAEGVAEPVVVWALARELRLLAGLRHAAERGEALGRAIARAGVFKRRQALVERAVKRAGTGLWRRQLVRLSKADREVKGQAVGDPWKTLEWVVLAMAGAGQRSSAARGS